MAEDKGTIKAGWYVALVIDVLGQHEAILNAPPFPKTEGEKANYLTALKDSAGKVIEVRRLVQVFFESYLRASHSDVADKLDSEQRAQFAIFRECRISTQMFSDTVIAFAPISTTVGRVTTKAVEAMMMAAISTLVHCLAEEIVVRGAIDVDEAIELGDHDLYGRVVVNVHRMEESVAQWPRIVVGKGMLDFLDEMSHRTCRDFVDRMNCEKAKACLGIITPDVDAVPIIDYLSVGLAQGFGAPLAEDVLQQCRGFINREHARFSRAGDHKLALRYGLLRQYYDKST
ncbi:MAG: hypothetical protein ACM3VT_17070 [Solirubrobacterales bacterium]